MACTSSVPQPCHTHNDQIWTLENKKPDQHLTESTLPKANRGGVGNFETKRQYRRQQQTAANREKKQPEQHRLHTREIPK
jgi:hypothetical protein